MTKKQIQKEAEDRVNAAFKKHFNNVQVNMMDLGAIMHAIEVYVKSDDVDTKMVELVKRYRKN